MRWMLGLDLEDRCHGVLAVARWLRAATPPPAVQEFVAVHVIDERLRRILRTDLMHQVMVRAEEEMRQLVEVDGAAPFVAEQRLVLSDSPERGLTDMLASAPFDALLIGRIAERAHDRLVRLGRVARRLLRRLPVPVIVAPPDLTASSFGRGAIVLASDLGHASKTAAEFAYRIARDLRRELVVLHVDPGLELVSTFFGEAVVAPTDTPHPVLADVEDWIRALGLESARARLGEGPLVESILDVAHDEDAPLVVCGSRGLGLVDRMFVSSSATDLARLADRPVAVVPSSRVG